MPDSQVNYLQQLANGNVQAVFPGGVLIEQGGATPPQGGRVEWIRDAASGAYVASLWGWEADGFPSGKVKVLQLDASLDGGQGLAADRTALQLSGGDSPANLPQAVLSVANRSRTLLNSTGLSDFIQSSNLNNMAFYAGATGPINNGASGTTAALSAVGFASLSVAVVCPIQLGNFGQGGWNTDFPAATQLRIYNNTGVTSAFHYMVIGVRA
jgi:hypothetical protein